MKLFTHFGELIPEIYFLMEDSVHKIRGSYQLFRGNLFAKEKPESTFIYLEQNDPAIFATNDLLIFQQTLNQRVDLRSQIFGLLSEVPKRMAKVRLHAPI